MKAPSRRMPWNSDSWKLLGSAETAASALREMVLNETDGRAFTRSLAYRAPDMERVGSLLTKSLLGRDETKGGGPSPAKTGSERGKSDFGSWVGKKPVAGLY